MLKRVQILSVKERAGTTCYLNIKILLFFITFLCNLPKIKILYELLYLLTFATSV